MVNHFEFILKKDSKSFVVDFRNSNFETNKESAKNILESAKNSLVIPKNFDLGARVSSNVSPLPKISHI